MRASTISAVVSKFYWENLFWNRFCNLDADLFFYTSRPSKHWKSKLFWVCQNFWFHVEHVKVTEKIRCGLIVPPNARPHSWRKPQKPTDHGRPSAASTRPAGRPWQGKISMPFRCYTVVMIRWKGDCIRQIILLLVFSEQDSHTCQPFVGQ